MTSEVHPAPDGPARKSLGRLPDLDQLRVRLHLDATTNDVDFAAEVVVLPELGHSMVGRMVTTWSLTKQSLECEAL